MGKKLTLDLPDELKLDSSELVVLLAAHLYEHGLLSLGHAAAFAGMDKRTFIESLGKYGVSVFNYGPEDLKREFRDD